MNDLTSNETFMRFGKNFQERLCQLMLEDRPFFDQIMEVLDISFFEKKYSHHFILPYSYYIVLKPPKSKKYFLKRANSFFG